MKIKSFKPKQHRQMPASIRPNEELRVREMDGAPEARNSVGTLKIIPLGGVGDVTKNMYVYEYGNDIIIIDCGVGFPDDAMPGVDLVIPDASYLKDKKHKIKGIVITHAHDDHIGGLPYIWPDLNVDIYAQKLTAGLIQSKFIEHKLPKDKIKVINPESELKLGSFTISFYRVAHSIPDSVAIVMRTPIGTLIHQADFKIDWTPVNGQVTDVGAAARLGEQGVIYLALDCLRVEKAGMNPSEMTIEPTFERVVQNTKGKVLITMTSSNITRVQQAINVAARNDRKIILSGRSMEGVFQVARDLGYLEVPPSIVIAQEQSNRFPDSKQLILIAGSQGQPGSALSRVAHNDHKYIHLTKDDAVVFSADPIPSTESTQSSLIDTLTRLGAEVYYSAMTSDLHVSGHAAAEELKMMISLIKPKYILPIGGTFRHMKSFARMAKSLGYKDDQILMAQDGQVIEIDKNKAVFKGVVPVQNVYVDGLGVGDVGSVILRDRQVMSEEGVVIVTVRIDPQTGKLAGDVDIISRGFVFGEESEDMIDAGREIVKHTLSGETNVGNDWRYLRHQIEESLEKFFYAELKRSPLVLPLIVEV